MKIKSDFVTNSSSTCYIFSCKQYISKKSFGFKGLGVFDDILCTNKRGDVIAFTENAKKSDWISEARGPTQYWNLTHKEYETCIQLINVGKYVLVARLERSRQGNIDRLNKKMDETNSVLVLMEAH